MYLVKLTNTVTLKRFEPQASFPDKIVVFLHLSYSVQNCLLTRA